MATYVYQCDKCGTEKEVNHLMSEVDEPSKELLEQTTCNAATCPFSAVNDGNGEDWDLASGERFKRVPQMFAMDADKLINSSSKREKFSTDRKKRSSKNFEQDVLPSLKGTERQHFVKKRGFKS